MKLEISFSPRKARRGSQLELCVTIYFPWHPTYEVGLRWWVHSNSVPKLRWYVMTARCSSFCQEVGTFAFYGPHAVGSRCSSRHPKLRGAIFLGFTGNTHLSSKRLPSDCTDFSTCFAVAFSLQVPFLMGTNGNQQNSRLTPACVDRQYSSVVQIVTKWLFDWIDTKSK